MQYVPVETVRTEYVDRVKVLHDTMHTTEKETTYINGDTVIITKYVDRVKVLHQTDTCIIERTDTVQVPYPIEKKISKWEQTKSTISNILYIIAIAIILATICYVKLFQNRK